MSTVSVQIWIDAKVRVRGFVGMESDTISAGELMARGRDLAEQVKMRIEREFDGWHGLEVEVIADHKYKWYNY